MSKSKLGYFIDNIAIFLISFIISFVIIKSMVANNIICLIISSISSFLIFKIVLYFQNENLRKLSIKNSEKQNILNCNFALRKMTLNNQTTFFKNMLKENDVKITSYGLIIDNKILLHIALNIDIIKPEHLFSIYAKIKNTLTFEIKEICLICNKVSEDVKSIITNFDIKFTLFSPEETYAMMKTYSFFPPLPPQPAKIKTNLLKSTFIKRKGKTFINCSLGLYLFSLFTPLTKYYLISASILFLIGLFLICFGKHNKNIEPLSKQILLKKTTN